MASLGSTFNPNDVPDDERSFEPMPAGDYACQITDSEIVETRTGGEMLKLTIEVIEGPFANRKVWDNLNIRNANATAQSIAHRALADLCAACGTGPISDSEELHFKPFVAALKIEPERTVGDRTYDARNAVKRYKARGGLPPVGKNAAQPAQRSAQATGAPRPNGTAPSRPWANRGQPEAARHEDPPF